MKYKPRNDISNVKRIETDELDRLVRNINVRVAEEDTVRKEQEENNKSHIVEHSMTAKIIGRAIEGAVVGAMLPR